MPARNANESGLKAPPPPPELVGAGPPPEVAGAWFSVTLTDALSDRPLAVELQLIPKVSMTDEVSRAAASVTVSLPLVALEPAQLSSAPPPVAVQPVAFEELHVRVTAPPAVIDAGEAQIVAVTEGQLTTTEVDVCAVSPFVDDVHVIVSNPRLANREPVVPW
jgi:hypothetical protein